MHYLRVVVSVNNAVSFNPVSYQFFFQKDKRIIGGNIL
jgi:hypothetical protein